MPGAPAGLAWDRTAAAVAAVSTLPAVAVTLGGDVHAGASFAVGVLPAALAGLAPRRRQRVRGALLSALAGVCILIGGVIAEAPVLAVAAIAALGVGTAWLAARSLFGMLAMTLALPMVGIGLSFDVSEAAGAAALITAGGLWAWLVSLAWPESEPSPRPARAPGTAPTLAYGVRLGAAGATAAAIGFGAGLDHVGWAVAAALLVMRPAAEMQRLRSIGRLVSVFAGALAGVALVAWDPPSGVYAVAIAGAVAAAAGTHPSRWYVTAGFTTFLVFLIYLSADPDTAGERFGERVGETLLGVALAALFGMAGSRRPQPG
ncbi:MAG: FUSC family protein [Solirubrobacteraceae bacterium]